MKMPQAADQDKERFRRLAPDRPGVEVRPMFGQLGAFVDGAMFAGLFGTDIGVKLAEEDLVALREAGAGPFGPAERPMGGYVSLPAGADDDEAARWVAKAAAYVATLPRKARKR